MQPMTGSLASPSGATIAPAGATQDHGSIHCQRTWTLLPMHPDCQYLENLLHHEIPLTRAMQLRVHSYENHELRLAMPLAPNTNHTGSMFGGSLYSISVLAGWGWLTLRLREAGIDDGHIVIKGGQIDYPLPVVEEAVAICRAPSEEDWKKFETMYRRRGRARLYLDIRILAPSGETAVHLHGEYVLHK